jgi:hypothetical protein
LIGPAFAGEATFFVPETLGTLRDFVEQSGKK